MTAGCPDVGIRYEPEPEYTTVVYQGGIIQQDIVNIIQNNQLLL